MGVFIINTGMLLNTQASLKSSTAILGVRMLATRARGRHRGLGAGARPIPQSLEVKRYDSYLPSKGALRPPEPPLQAPVLCSSLQFACFSGSSGALALALRDLASSSHFCTKRQTDGRMRAAARVMTVIPSIALRSALHADSSAPPWRRRRHRVNASHV